MTLCKNYKGKIMNKERKDQKPTLDQLTQLGLHTLYDLVSDNHGWVCDTSAWRGSIAMFYNSTVSVGEALELTILTLKTSVTIFENPEYINLLQFDLDDPIWQPSQSNMIDCNLVLPSDFAKVFITLCLIHEMVSEDEVAEKFIRWSMLCMYRAAAFDALELAA
jgi:hypothetical protein